MIACFLFSVFFHFSSLTRRPCCRQGFAAVAISAGVPIIPVFTENIRWGRRGGQGRGQGGEVEAEWEDRGRRGGVEDRRGGREDRRIGGKEDVRGGEGG